MNDEKGDSSVDKSMDGSTTPAPSDGGSTPQNKTKDGDSSASLLKDKLSKVRSDWIKARSQVANQKDEIEELKRKLVILEQDQKYRQEELEENQERQQQILQKMEETRKEASEVKLRNVQIQSERDELEEKVNEAWERVASLEEEAKKWKQAQEGMKKQLEEELEAKALGQREEEGLRAQLQTANERSKALSQSSALQDKSSAQLVNFLVSGIEAITDQLDDVSSVCLASQDEKESDVRRKKAAELASIGETLAQGQEGTEDPHSLSVAQMLLDSLVRSIKPFSTIIVRAESQLAERNEKVNSLNGVVESVTTENEQLVDELEFLKEKIETFEKLENVFDTVVSEKCALESELAELRKQLLQVEANADEAPPLESEGMQDDAELRDLYHALQFQYKEALKYISDELEPLTENQATELRRARDKLREVDSERTELLKERHRWEKGGTYANLLETIVVLARAYTGVSKDFGEVLHQRKALLRLLRDYEGKFGPWQAGGNAVGGGRRGIRRFRIAVVVVLASLRLLKIHRSPKYRECIWAQRLPVVGCPRARHRLRLPAETRTYLLQGQLAPSVSTGEVRHRYVSAESLALPTLFVDRDAREIHTDGLPTYIGMLEDMVTVAEETGPSPPPLLSEQLQARLKGILYVREPSTSSGRSRTPQNGATAPMTDPTVLRRAPAGKSPLPNGLGHTLSPSPVPIPYPALTYHAGVDPSALNSSSIAAHSSDTSLGESMRAEEEYLRTSITQDRSREDPNMTSMFACEILGAIEALDKRVTGALQRRR
ncbi:hypothetical protein ADEAN_000725400 [Angomonas deanei]|uniref:Uncharacterized protein n=1 Tax=Angomonas deanei TaxID=59799 RepID=A0A7G2CK42_9TRYP|nr:hypothetical protein ADEAN_000725400 [Angomonas deanei]